VLRVHFMNNSSKAFKVDQNTNVQKLREMVIERIGLKEAKYFFLFEKREDYGEFLFFCVGWIV
jgi:hypothetical protein